MSAPTSLLEGRRVVVCVGTGGVGKTTVAAGLALAAAQAGRRVLVMTIDPSRRLAQALGIDPAAGAAGAPLEVVAPTGDPQGRAGSLTARVLDVQYVFDNLVRTRASSPAQAERIMNNRIYRHFSASMAGSHEYAAVEALYDAYHDDAYDLVVLDTPPSQNAVDFLEAPQRILHFLQGKGLADGVPGAGAAKAISKKLFDLGGSLVTRAVSKVSGAETLQEVLGFLHALTDLYDSFRARAEAVGKLLSRPDVAFVLVGAPSPAQLAALGHFVGELSAHKISPRGFVLNRVRPDPYADFAGGPKGPGGAGEAALTEVFTAPEQRPALRACVEAANDEHARARRDAAFVGKLTRTVAPVPVWTLAERAGEADDRGALLQLAGELARLVPVEA